jgi:hypothetical protein
MRARVSKTVLVMNTDPDLDPAAPPRERLFDPPPERLAVNTVVTLEEVEGKYTITRSELEAVGRVVGIDEAASPARHGKRSRRVQSHARWPEVSRSVRTAVSRKACRLPASPRVRETTVLKED